MASLNLRFSAPRKRSRKLLKRPAKRRVTRPSQRRETGTIHIEDGKVRMMLPGKIKSLNQLKSGIARYGDTKAWEQRIKKARVAADDESVCLPVTSRARLEMVRLIPTRACLLDQTNVEGGVKGLEDALKRLGFIFDDNHKWLDRPQVTQLLSPDKQYWAMVTITVLE